MKNMRPTWLLMFLLVLADPAFAADEPPLAVSIAVPSNGAERVVRYTGPTTENRIYVVLTNVSKDTRRVWEQWCAAGFATLSFEITDASGKTWTASRGNGVMNWSAGSVPTYNTLQPGGHIILEALASSFSFDPKESWGAKWTGFPKPEGDKGITCTVRAVYQIKKEDGMLWPGKGPQPVWLGRIVSEPVKITFYN